MAVAVEHRIEQDGVRPQPLDMLHPVQQPEDAAGSAPVVLRRCAAQAQGIDLIEDRLVKPHIGHSFCPPAGSLRRRCTLIAQRAQAGAGKKTGRAPTGPPCGTAAEPPPGMPCDILTLYSFSLKNQEKGGESEGSLLGQIGEDQCDQRDHQQQDTVEAVHPFRNFDPDLGYHKNTGLSI